MTNSRFSRHRERAYNELYSLGKGKIRIDPTFLNMHHCFISIDKRNIIVVCPYQENNNYCLNLNNAKKIEILFSEKIKKNTYILFAKFLPGGFTLMHCIPWTSFNFATIPVETGELGDYYFLKESFLERLKQRNILPLFDGLAPISNEFEGLFQ